MSDNLDLCQFVSVFDYCTAGVTAVRIALEIPHHVTVSMACFTFGCFCKHGYCRCRCPCHFVHQCVEIVLQMYIVSPPNR